MSPNPRSAVVTTLATTHHLGDGGDGGEEDDNGANDGDTDLDIMGTTRVVL